MKKTTKQLKKEATELYDLIYGEVSCYRTKDLIRYSNVLVELEKRGIKPVNELRFND